MKRNSSNVRLLNAKDLALVVGSRSLAYRLLSTKGFPTIFIGCRKLVREDSLNRWFLAQENKPEQIESEVTLYD